MEEEECSGDEFIVRLPVIARYRQLFGILLDGACACSPILLSSSFYCLVRPSRVRRLLRVAASLLPRLSSPPVASNMERASAAVKSAQKRSLVLGSTGGVGRHVVRVLVEDPRGARSFNSCVYSHCRGVLTI